MKSINKEWENMQKVKRRISKANRQDLTKTNQLKEDLLKRNFSSLMSSSDSKPDIKHIPNQKSQRYKTLDSEIANKDLYIESSPMIRLENNTLSKELLNSSNASEGQNQKLEIAYQEINAKFMRNSDSIN